MLYDKASFSHKVSILKEAVNDVKQRSSLVYDPLRKNDQSIKHDNHLVSQPPIESGKNKLFSYSWINNNDFIVFNWIYQNM